MADNFIKQLSVPDAAGNAVDYKIRTYGDLKFGSKTWNGSDTKTITAADLGLGTAFRFIGISTTDPRNGTITIEGTVVTPQTGDVVLFADKVEDDAKDVYEEFVYTGSVWELMGGSDNRSIKGHTHVVNIPGANFNHTHSFTGNNVRYNGTFTGSKMNHKHTITANGSISSNSITPAGNVTASFTGDNISHKHNFNGTEGDISVTGQPNGTISINSITPIGNVTTVEHGHTFTGTPATISVSGTPKASVSTTYTPKGTVSVNFTTKNVGHKHSFTGDNQTITVSGAASGTISETSITPTGNVSANFTGSNVSHTHTFTGNQATITVSGQPNGTISSVVKTVSSTKASAVTSALDFNGYDSSTLTLSFKAAPVAQFVNSVTNTSGAPSFTGTSTTFTGTYTPVGTIANTNVKATGNITANFTGTPAEHSHVFTGIAVESNTVEQTPAGSIYTYVTPQGTVGYNAKAISVTTEGSNA